MKQITTEKALPLAAYPENWDGFSIRRVSPWAMTRANVCSMLVRARQYRGTNQMLLTKVARFEYRIQGMNTILVNTRPGAIS